MKYYKTIFIICLLLATKVLLSQTSTPTIPEEARKHFIMGITLFKDAKTVDDYSLAEAEFKKAADLAPQWPDVRYNLALAKEAERDYSGAEEDLKVYVQLNISDEEKRTAQDKIYELEAKQEKKNAPMEKAKKEKEDRKAQYPYDGSIWKTTSIVEYSKSGQPYSHPIKEHSFYYDDGGYTDDQYECSRDTIYSHTFYYKSNGTLSTQIKSKVCLIDVDDGDIDISEYNSYESGCTKEIQLLNNGQTLKFTINGFKDGHSAVTIMTRQ